MRTQRCTAAPRSPARWMGVAVVAVTALSVSGCGGSGGTSAAKPTASVTPSSPSPSSAMSSRAASSAAPAGSGSTGTVVTANESEFKISLSSTTFTPGRYTFIAKNVGQAPHALEIDGPGVSDRKTPTISPGASTPVTVALQKGSYEVYCPVDSHKAMGMDLHITVS